ncbi:two-component system response regulator YesN [Hydrogenispora ethanolica]|uniref:Two-component system response regulator YesN n=1 Tax=Hydrogenispora ethanolica TaxID=1082276 RepID=A0A4R1QZC7_HYDET|nr:response regulator [Hydrogenispora ethanolica]TCL58340.1 two-component system response regulator YesN [Hydrogenispora ethanolica]
MVKVLIVDDELLVRVGLKSYIDWAKHGFELLEDARDGVEALERIAAEPPDILLTDIKMPRMDGLELIRRIRERNLAIRIIVLSCYEDFETVKEAMKLGAVDYIRKLSIKADEILAVLNAVRDQGLPGEESGRGPRPAAEGTGAAKSRLLQKNEFFRGLLQQERPAPLPDEENAAGIRLDQGWPLCLSLDGYRRIRRQHRNQAAFQQAVIGMSEQVLKSFQLSGAVFQIEEREFGIAVRSAACDREFVAALQRQIGANMNISVSIGIGPAYAGAEQFAAAYGLARRIGTAKFYLGPGAALRIPEDLGGDEVREFRLGNPEFIRSLEDALTLRRNTEASRLIAGVFAQARQAGNIHPEAVRRAALDLLGVFSRTAAFFQGDIGELEFDQSRQHHQTLMELEFLDDLAAWFAGFLPVYLDYLRGKAESRHSELVGKAIDYIEAHKDKNLTLAELAAALNVSEAYLSSLFKREVGRNFVGYLTGLKVDLAKEYLRQGRLVYETAELIGFENSNYFAKVFKKYTGMTPDEYRCLAREGR